jgi:DNA-binding MarR family transcriptional regulator
VLRRAARRVSQAYDQALRPSGLRLSQYSLLANLERHGGLTITDLAEILMMDRTTLTRNLRPLEADGLVRVVPGADRRSRAVELTPAGGKAIAAARPLWREAERSFRESMGGEEAAALRRLLRSASAGETS